jgi:YegS/Rv2252/BmrU family lipid kinase
MQPKGENYNNTSLKIFFVINPRSGKRPNKDWKTFISEYFSSSTHQIDFLSLSGKNDAVSLKQKLEQFKPDRVIAVGGDGTVSLVAKQLIGSSIAMGILPAGSANGMAKELQIPTGAEEALDIVINGKIKCSDLICINDASFCLHLSDVGINAQLIKYFEEDNMRGMFGYLKLVFKVLIRKRLMHAYIKTDKEEVKTSAFMVVIANASKYGTGALINPEGNLHDGLFEIVIVRRINFWAVLKIFLQFKTLNPRKVEILQAKSAMIKTTKKIHFQIDGEYLGKVNQVKADIMPSQLNLILPAKRANLD